MQSVFINFTNHPVVTWSEEQRKAAEQYGKIVDIPFPGVDPKSEKKDIMKLAEAAVDEITRMNPNAVLCQGEFCLAYQVIRKLQEKGFLVFAACSERKAIENKRGKTVIFEFEQFREY